MKVKQAAKVQSKWIKTKILLQNSSIKPFIPDTRRWNEANLKQMIRDYKMIYIKPERGTYGNGVIRAEHKEGSYKYQLKEKVHNFDSFPAFYQSLSRTVGKRSYLIQKGIRLLKHSGRRFDIRVMVQNSPQGVWEATGIIGRLGQKGKIVTNYHSGGRPLAIGTLLQSHLGTAQQTRLTEELYALGVRIARQMNKTYPNIRQIGVDVGLDAGMTPWIIEVNTNPDPYIFNQLKDKSMYRKVMRYRRAAKGK
ncbi:YheC/YheD family protein [Paenibacillus sp. JX-17]|uniref:YheC/YheD family protein n=1 Tax=Paenibacillus lacisoli TaxID=3064525 RepID=A0ABT9CG71_9BACL|nr:YheC/YheD family protein [Paenibacillus sp. JX-17]MDO7908284.1 YheC/YheD family protein [Paenibacillus sp. JX-17]